MSLAGQLWHKKTWNMLNIFLIFCAKSGLDGVFLAALAALAQPSGVVYVRPITLCSRPPRERRVIAAGGGAAYAGSADKTQEPCDLVVLWWFSIGVPASD